MALYELDGLSPQLADTAWVADNAQVIGNVTWRADSSVWFGVTVRGDTETITIGQGSNIQDGSVLHADVGMPLVVGDNVTVGHKVMLHGCTIGDESLIGIGAIVLNGAKIGKNCLVGAGSLVTEHRQDQVGLMFALPALLVYCVIVRADKPVPGGALWARPAPRRDSGRKLSARGSEH